MTTNENINQKDDTIGFPCVKYMNYGKQAVPIKSYTKCGVVLKLCEENYAYRSIFKGAIVQHVICLEAIGKPTVSWSQ